MAVKGSPGAPQGRASAPQLLAQAAEALDAAHKLGMIHRDIKPDNIVLINAPEGEIAKVLDFGIAKLKEARMSGEAKLTLTGAGVLVGTPQYMSPEQALGKELDARTDLFSFGLVLYEMATGRQAFTGATSGVVFDAILNRAPLALVRLNPALPPRLGVSPSRGFFTCRGPAFSWRCL